MKIAYFVHDYHRHGGHSRYVAELASRFKKNHEVHVFANKWDEPDPIGIKFHKVPALSNRELLKVLTFVLPATWLASRNFDIIHSQGLCGLRHDVTTAHFIQSVWLRELKERGQKPSNFIWLWKYLVSPLERYALGPKCSKRVIAISKKNIKDLKNEYKIGNNVDLIYHGVDLEKFHPKKHQIYRKIVRQELNIPNNAFVALFAGNLQKGAAAAIRAIANVKNAYLVLVSGSENSKEKQITQDLQIQNQIIWIPKSNQIEKYFLAVDCFVFPTVYEPFGMVISEAMASGLPVITSREAGAADLIRHGETGFLVDEPWNYHKIGQHIDWLMNNRESAKMIGQLARKAIEPFTWDKCAQDTLACYQMILNEKWKIKSR
jgi:UDP-glucose:(heptosyl)LPS alpha-1,3-glucosyltransferase